MMETEVLLAVSILWALAAMTPGPNFFITVHTAIEADKRLSCCTVLGIVVGTLVWSVSGYLGIALLFNTVPVLYIFLKITGGLYLMYIGLNLLRGKGRRPQKQRGGCRSAIGCFRLGLLTNILNPKTAAFMTSLFAATIPPNASIRLGAMSVLLICSISALWYVFVSSLFSSSSVKKFYGQQKQRVEKIAGALFLGFGLKLALAK